MMGRRSAGRPRISDWSDGELKNAPAERALNAEMERLGVATSRSRPQPFFAADYPDGTLGRIVDYAFSPTGNSATLKGTPHPRIPQ